MSATLYSDRLDSFFRENPFIHISTFGGAEVGCFVALEVLDILGEPGFLEHVLEMAALFEAGFADLLERHPRALVEARQCGLMMGLKLAGPRMGPWMTAAGFQAGLLAIYANNDPSVIQVLPAAALFLWPSPAEFPMDDTYIHFVYAGNLSEQGRLFFNNPDEKGVGTSSILWTLILAGGKSLGLSMHWVAKLIGVASLATVGLGLYLLLRPKVPEMPALVGSLAVALSGHLLWFALSGMETMLFLALAICIRSSPSLKGRIWLCCSSCLQYPILN